MGKNATIWSLVLLSSVLVAPSTAQDASCIFSANGTATAYIEYIYETDEGPGIERGSGFVISPQGYLITNSHVVSSRLPDVTVRSESVAVRVGGLANDPVIAQIVARDPAADLALLKLPPRADEAGWPSVAVGQPRKLGTGAWLTAIGYPGADLSLVPPAMKTSENTVIDGQLMPWWQTSLPLNAGNSGGPVFGGLGTVIGVAVAKKEGAQLITYVIPIDRAQHLLTFAGVPTVSFGQCAIFPECRHESHGIESYTVEELLGRWGGWRGGGYNRQAYCNDYLTQLRRQYPGSTFDFIGDDERSREHGFRHFEYRYFCEFRRREGPVFKSERSQVCIAAEANPLLLPRRSEFPRTYLGSSSVQRVAQFREQQGRPVCGDVSSSCFRASRT